MVITRCPRRVSRPNFACSTCFPALGFGSLKSSATAPVSTAPSRRLFFGAWVVVPVCALGFLLWVDVAKVRRIEHVSGLAPWSTEAPVLEANSPTGYAGGKRRLIVPGHEAIGYQWIEQTQQMLARGEWRVRHVDYDNAPFGRETRAASPYRWWLGLLAWIDQAISGRPLAVSVEHAALFAGPAWHVLLLIGATIFAARRFGRTAAAAIAVGLAMTFPFAGEFLPGAPDDHGPALACALGSLLPLLAGMRTLRGGDSPTAAEENRARRDFFIAGLLGGTGLWIDANFQAPLVLGIMLGGIAAAWVGRRNPPAGIEIPWRRWAAGGCFASLIGYMVEYFPREMTLDLDANHPLFALAWLGGGELLTRAVIGIERKKFVHRVSDVAATLAALAAVAALPLIKTTSGQANFFGGDPLAERLTALNGGIAAPNLAGWIARDGFSLAVVSTCLPALLVVFAVTLLVNRRLDRPTGPQSCWRLGRSPWPSPWPAASSAGGAQRT